MRLLPATLTCLLIVPVTGFAQESRVISGQVTYLDRMALPDDAVVLVEVTGADGDLLSEVRLPTDGRQVPVPFALEAPALQDVFVLAGITMGAELVWLGDPVRVADDPVDLVLGRYQPVGFNATFRCGDRTLRTGFADEALVLDTGAARVVLQAVATASGARYDAVDDPGTFFWNRGATALVSVDDEEWPECRVALPPVTPAYVARGNEPFWSVTIDAGAMTVSRPGVDDLTYPVSAAGLQGDGAILVTANDDASLLRENGLCQDDMSGMPYPETVTLTLGAEVFTGCGGDSRDLLTGRTWVVRNLAGRDLPDDIDITLVFDIADRVAGMGGCNNWFAGYALSGEGLSFTQPGATMMACAEPAMVQERAFFAALEQVKGFEIAPDGSLVLFGMGEPVIRAEAGAP